MDLLQVFAEYFASFVTNPTVAQLVSGAAEGIIIGLVVGAIVWAIMEAPDTLGRALLFSIILGIVVIIWEFARIGAVMGMGLGSIIAAMNDNPRIGTMFWTALIHTFYAMIIGTAIGVGSLVPNLMVKGAIIGLFLGALTGAAINFALFYFGIRMSPLYFRGLVSLGTWGLLVAFSGRD